MDDLNKYSLIEDLSDIYEILNDNGFGLWCPSIQKTITLLKEGEAVEPISERGEMYPLCGNCKSWLLRSDKFCSECGKKVKWG